MGIFLFNKRRNILYKKIFYISIELKGIRFFHPKISKLMICFLLIYDLYDLLDNCWSFIDFSNLKRFYFNISWSILLPYWTFILIYYCFVHLLEEWDATLCWINLLLFLICFIILGVLLSGMWEKRNISSYIIITRHYL